MGPITRAQGARATALASNQARALLIGAAATCSNCKQCPPAPHFTVYQAHGGLVTALGGRADGPHLHMEPLRPRKGT